MRRRAVGGSLNLFHVVVALVLVAGGVAGYLGYEAYVAAPAPPSAIVAPGDRITVNYIGMLEDRKVFDTSLREVAVDNVTYPKAPSFQWRSTWRPLEFTVGAGAVVKGFDQGVIGMRVGQTKVLTLPPVLAYGPSKPEKIESRSLTEAVPLIATLSRAAYRANFSVEPALGLAAPERTWGWNATVVALAGDNATIVRGPLAVNEVVRPYGAWSATVVAIDEGRQVALVRHLLTPADANNLKVTLPSGEVAYVTYVDPTPQGRFTLDRNDPLAGRTLIFQVTVVSVTKLGGG